MDRNWALTVAHLFDRPDNPGIYSFRFGAVNNQNDQNDPTHLRSIDRIVLAPRGDMAMVHFADPVPEGTWIPSLANQAPRVFDWAHMYGWGPAGTVLNWASALVYDPVATANAAFQRAEYPIFAESFAEGIGPIVLNVATVAWRLGRRGIFAPRSPGRSSRWERGLSSRQRLGKPFPALLLGFLSAAGVAVPAVDSGRHQRCWFVDGPGHDELRRRRLDETKSGDLPMAAPPQPDVCDEGASKCSVPDPVWLAATLTAPSAGDGLVAATCPGGDGNSCSFDGSPYATGSPGQVKVGSGRQVMVWCKTTDTLAVGAEPQRVLRVSFTNADRDQGPIGQGWWDVSPGQVAAAAGPVDTARRCATCWTAADVRLVQRSRLSDVRVRLAVRVRTFLALAWRRSGWPVSAGLAWL